MNEIEVKAKLKDKNQVLEHLKKSGLVIHKKKHQKDTVFFPKDITATDEHSLGRNFLRIREQKEGETHKTFFTLKQPRSNQTDCLEYEIEIQGKEIETLSSLIETLGYYKFITVEKEREAGKLEGGIEVCLDEVAGLGSFIELEKFGPEGDASRIQGELYALLESWGVSKEDFAYDGYDILVHNATKK